MAALTYKLPWPPSGNRAYRAVAGRVLLSAAGRAYIKQVVNALPKGLVTPLKSRLTVIVTLHPPVALCGRWDVMNREKLLSDSLTKAKIWADDSQIDEFTMKRGVPTLSDPAGFALVRIWED